tara:strand:+ start:18 stop:209 length:192 start_codon:yes stop_codon:yes gene_type:complete
MIIHQKLHKMTTADLDNELKVWTEWVEERLQDQERIDDLLEELSQREQDREESRKAAWLSVQK